MKKLGMILLVAAAFTLLVLNLIFEMSDRSETAPEKTASREYAGNVPETRFSELPPPPAPTTAPAPSVMTQPDRSYSGRNKISAENTASGGLVAYYPFNGNANDESGNGNHGTVHGATLTADRHGNPNSAYYFDGKSWITIRDHFSIKPGNSITLSAWVKIQDISEINDYLRIISKHGEVTDAGGSHGSYQLVTGRKKERGTCYFTMRTNVKYFSVPTSTPLQLNQWHMITATWDGSTAKVYIDDEVVAISNFPGTIKYDNNNLYIGRDGYYDKNLFTGIIDEVKIYDRALTNNEVLDNFRR